MKYSHCGLLLSQILSFSISISRGAGGSSISPNLTFRATVSDASPAFSLLSFDEMIKVSTQNIDYLKWATQKLYCLFREQKASPSDVNTRGETLLHVACQVALTSFACSRGDIQSFRGLIFSLLAWGVEPNETDIEGVRPLDHMISVPVKDPRECMSLGIELLEKGLEFSDLWLLSPRSSIVFPGYVKDYYRYIATLLVRFRLVDEVLDGMRCGRLSRAVLLRSETQVTQLVENFPDCLCEKNVMGHTPMHLAASWPAGVSILLNAGANNLVNEPDSGGFLPIAYASYSECLAAVQLLVDADSALYSDEKAFATDPRYVWYSKDVLCDAISYSSEEVANCIVQALGDRRRRLASIASQELPWAVKEPIGISPNKVIDASAALVYKLLKQTHIRLLPSLLVPSTWQTIYHLLYNPHDLKTIDHFQSLTYWADIFYNAGFHDFVGHDGPGQNLLMVTFFDLRRPSTQYLDLYLWYLRKGLRLGHKEFRRTDEGDWIAHTPAAFYVGLFIVNMLSEPQADSDSTVETKLRSLLAKVINERTSDDCKCACSIHGCHALTSMLKVRKRRFQMFHYGETDRVLYHLSIVLANLLDISNDGWSFFPAKILRFLTFETLEMTHTCCFYQNGSGASYFEVFNDNDRIEIQEEESADLDGLEKLMLEFQHAYTNLGVPLPEFLEGYWTTRMDEVMSGGEAISADEASQLREWGVTWEPREQHCTTPCSLISSPSEDRDVIFDENMISRPSTEGLKRRHSF